MHYIRGKFDNHAAAYDHIKAVPLAAAMGAEIQGVDIADLSDAAFAEIRHALYRHKMIYFRDQSLSHADQDAFSRRFGPYADDAFTQGVPEFRNVQPVIREAADPPPIVFGEGWHTDSPFLDDPPAISMLYGVEIPPFGGDTIWANAALAYDSLSEGMKTMLAPLQVIMNRDNSLNYAYAAVRANTTTLGRDKTFAEEGFLDMAENRTPMEAYHPLVREHPITGELALYCDQTYSNGLVGFAADEARALLDYLIGFLTQPAHTCRLRWVPGTFAIWDNRLCVHRAFNDYDGYRRVMYRTTIAREAELT